MRVCFSWIRVCGVVLSKRVLCDPHLRDMWERERGREGERERKRARPGEREKERGREGDREK